MAAWLEKHHNKPEYQLIIRKAKGWVNKFVKEAQIDLPIMAEVQALVK
jgi:hypothetical protein